MTVWLLGLVQLAIGFGAGVPLGMYLGSAHSKRLAAIQAQAQAKARERRIHDTQRVSVARPGTRPGRVSKATIDMNASHMTPDGREV